MIAHCYYVMRIHWGYMEGIVELHTIFTLFIPLQRLYPLHGFLQYHDLAIHRGSYMSAHVLLNLLNELGKSDKMRGSSILLLFATSLINSIIQEHEC